MNPLAFSLLLQMISGIASAQAPAPRADHSPAADPPPIQAPPQIDPTALAAVLQALGPARAPVVAPPLPAAANVVAVITFLMFGLLLLVKLFGPALGVAGGNVDFPLGLIGAGVVIILSFFFGSSLGSWSKNGAIAGSGAGGGAPVLLPPPTPAPPPQPAPLPLPAPAPATPDAGKWEEIRGKVSWFGGPSDKASGEASEGLALYEPADAAKRSDLFLPSGPGLLRRLRHDTAMYCAARWDYHKTPKAWLRGNQCVLINPANNKAVHVWPVDWGPNARTGRAIDISLAAMRILGLETDREAILRVPLPGGGEVEVKDPAGAGDAGSFPAVRPKVLSEAQVKKVFGAFSYSEAGGGRIVIDPAWVAENIIQANIPQLFRFTGGHAVQCHRKVAGELQDAFAAIEAAGLLDLILTFDGMWVPRHKTWNVKRGLSSHSWGIALDLNANWNGYDTTGAKPGTHGSLWEVAPFLERHGFAWGQEWTTKDPMHFEFAREV